MPERESGQGGITFNYKKKGDPLARTVGRGGALWANLNFWTPTASFRDPTEKDVENLKEMFSDVKWKGNIEVNVNHSPLFKQIKRLFSKDRRTNFFVRATMGLGNTLYYNALAHFARADYYNPYTESATIYHTHPDIQAQQIGRAKFYDQGDFSTFNSLFYSLPIARSQREWHASKIVMEHLKTDEERQRARKVLEPSLGTFAARDLGAIAGFLLRGADLGPAVNFPWHAPLNLIPNKFSLLPFVLLPSIGALVGHIHARASRRNIFFNKDEKVDSVVQFSPAAQTAAQPALAHAA